MAYKSCTSPHTSFRAGNKKVFCNLCGSTISLDECAYSTFSHDPRLPLTPLVDRCVSCKGHIERTHINYEHEDLCKTTFNKKLLSNLDFVLVGLGEKGENCGKFFATHLCKILICLKVHYTKQTCQRRACPECWNKWLVEERESIIARVKSKEARKRHKKMRLVNIMLSPDQKNLPDTRHKFELLLKSGYRYIRNKGAKGGCAVIHPYRATEEAKTLSLLANVKTWKWIREQKNPERYFYYSPHLHLMCYIRHMKEPKEGEKWIYKTKTYKSGKVINFLKVKDGEEKLRKRIGYFLSHTATVNGEEGSFHCVRWFGSCSYKKFKTTFEESKEGEKKERKDLRCKICGGMLMPFWSWVSMSYGDVLRDIRNNVLDPPRYWKEVVRTVEGEDPPADAEEYLI